MRTCIAYLLRDSAVHPTSINLREKLSPVYDLLLGQAAEMRCCITLLADGASKRCTYALQIGTFGALVIGAL